MTQLTSIDEVVEEFEQIANLTQEKGGWSMPYEGTYVGEKECDWLRSKLTTLVEQARQDVAKEVAMAGENKISLLDDDNFTGTYWISLNSLYFHLTGRHINADWESGVIEKNPSIEAFLREDAARTISREEK